MKKIIAVFTAVWMVAAMLCGCQSGQTSPTVSTEGQIEPVATTAPLEETVPQQTQEAPQDVMPLLLAVLTDRQSFSAEEYPQVYLRDYLKEAYSAAPVSYTFLDFDQDGQSELAIQTDCEQAAWLVIHCDGDKLYGFPYSFRTMIHLKADGSFDGSSSADSAVYMRLSFEDGVAYITETAKGDYGSLLFTIDGKVCSEAQWNDYVAAFDGKEEAICIGLEPVQEETTAPTEAPEPQPKPKRKCSDCGRREPEVTVSEKTGICEICQWEQDYVDNVSPMYCSRCNADCRFQGLTEGLCEDCYFDLYCRTCGQQFSEGEVNGQCMACYRESLGPDKADCPRCGVVLPKEELIDGFCKNCVQAEADKDNYCIACGEEDPGYILDGYCSGCYLLYNKVECLKCGELYSYFDMFECVCYNCNPYGGADPAEFCSKCGKYSFDSGMVNGKCLDCYYGH